GTLADMFCRMVDKGTWPCGSTAVSRVTSFKLKTASLGNATEVICRNPERTCGLHNTTGGCPNFTNFCNCLESSFVTASDTCGDNFACNPLCPNPNPAGSTSSEAGSNVITCSVRLLSRYCWQMVRLTECRAYSVRIVKSLVRSVYSPSVSRMASRSRMGPRSR